MLLAYNVLAHLALPLVAGWLVIEALRRGAVPEQWRGFLGLGRPPLPRGRPVVWVHAASVGESRAALPLLSGLREGWPDLAIVTTSTTPTGRGLVARQAIADVSTYLPLDLPWIVGPFLREASPRLVVILETEIWPNLLACCAATGVPVVVVNGRFSPRREPIYRHLAPFYRRALAPVSLFLMQGEEDAAVARRIVPDPGRVEVAGDLKVDQTLDSARGLDPGEVRARLGLGDRRVVVAGSLHPGEEGPVAEAFGRLSALHPDLVLVVAPRHLTNVERCVNALRSRGIASTLRTAGPLAAGARALVLDVIGELATVYAAAQAAFVGGTLVPVGGHNPFEPAAVGCPLAVGPHTDNFASEVERLVSAGGAVRVGGAADLQDALGCWLADPRKAREDGERAREVVAGMGGALARVLTRLEDYLGRRGAPASPSPPSRASPPPPPPGTPG